MTNHPTTIRQWFFSRSAENRGRAAERYAAIILAEGYRLAGYSAFASDALVALKFEVSVRALRGWKQRVASAPRAEWLFWLCDRRGA